MSVQTLLEEINNCERLGQRMDAYNIPECKGEARRKWLKDIVGDKIYPWANLGWDYRQFVRNNYEPRQLGLRTAEEIKGKIGEGLTKNMQVIIKELNSLISEPNPSRNSRAGVSDVPNQGQAPTTIYTIFNNELINLNKNPRKNKDQIKRVRDEIKNIINSFPVSAKEYTSGLRKQRLSQNAPYNDPFFKRNTTGESSSSYFVRTGSCKTKDSKEECKKKGHEWLGDKCYKGKYLFLDNSPGLKTGYIRELKGLVPSLINDATQINPESIIGILEGYSVPGLDIQDCSEHFANRNRFQIMDYIWGFIFVILLIFICWK